MAATVQDTALQIIAATASDAGVQLAVNWLNQRYQEFVARARTKQLRHWGQVTVPAPITAITATATQGSATVTMASNPGTVIGWQFRAQAVWYTIIAQTGATLTLDTPYTETGGSGLASTILQRWIPVTDPLARWMGSVSHPRLLHWMTYEPFATFQLFYPGRTLVQPNPWCWTEASRFDNTFDISTVLGSAEQKFFEVYPPSTLIETYAYAYWTIPQTLAVTANLPPEVDEYILREGVLVDVFRYKSEQWAAKGNMQMSEYYQKREAAQTNVWEHKIQEAVIVDSLYRSNMPYDFNQFLGQGDGGSLTDGPHQRVMLK